MSLTLHSKRRSSLYKMFLTLRRKRRSSLYVDVPHFTWSFTLSLSSYIRTTAYDVNMNTTVINVAWKPLCMMWYELHCVCMYMREREREGISIREYVICYRYYSSAHYIYDNCIYLAIMTVLPIRSLTSLSTRYLPLPTRCIVNNSHCIDSNFTH